MVYRKHKLLISKYVLCWRRYDKSGDSAWDSCGLREWLNDDFYRKAFTETERKSIVVTNVTADKNPSYDTKTGSDVQDKVFLLSISEAEKYFLSDEDRVCQPTRYAALLMKGDWGVDGDYCGWWLRTNGQRYWLSSTVTSAGSIDYKGKYQDDSDTAVRPALWISIGYLNDEGYIIL